MLTVAAPARLNGAAFRSELAAAAINHATLQPILHFHEPFDLTAGDFVEAWG